MRKQHPQRPALTYMLAQPRCRKSFAGILLTAVSCAGCRPGPPPPPASFFSGLPVSGSHDTALRAGFRHCVNLDAIDMRCRRHGVTLLGQGPYEAAVDMSGYNASSGFRQLTLWHDDDQYAIYKVIISLARRGWKYCYTGDDQWGDQAIFTRKGESVWISIDISYWGKRRLRVIPQWIKPKLSTPCRPDTDLVRFGTDIADAVRNGPSSSSQ